MLLLYYLPYSLYFLNIQSLNTYQLQLLLLHYQALRSLLNIIHLEYILNFYHQIMPLLFDSLVYLLPLYLYHLRRSLEPHYSLYYFVVNSFAECYLAHLVFVVFILYSYYISFKCFFIISSCYTKLVYIFTLCCPLKCNI